MSLSPRVNLALALAALASGPAAASAEVARAVRAPIVSECVSSYEQAQEQRRAGSLLAARRSLQRCVRDECPAFVRQDCGAWYEELQHELPTLVFTARSGGRDLTDVSISIGPRRLAERIDGRAIELDPGEYELEFRAAGMEPFSEHVVVARGEQNRLIRVELSSLAASREAREVPAPTASASRSWLAPGILAGIGVAGFAGFGALGTWGRSSEAKLERSCSPRCSEAEVSSVERKYLLADISLGVGVVGLVTGAYLFMSQRPEPRREEASRFDVQASGNGLSATYGGVF